MKYSKRTYTNLYGQLIGQKLSLYVCSCKTAFLWSRVWRYIVSVPKTCSSYIQHTYLLWIIWIIEILSLAMFCFLLNIFFSFYFQWVVYSISRLNSKTSFIVLSSSRTWRKLKRCSLEKHGFLVLHWFILARQDECTFACFWGTIRYTY